MWETSITRSVYIWFESGNTSHRMSFQWSGRWCTRTNTSHKINSRHLSSNGLMASATPNIHASHSNTVAALCSFFVCACVGRDAIHTQTRYTRYTYTWNRQRLNSACATKSIWLDSCVTMEMVAMRTLRFRAICSLYIVFPNAAHFHLRKHLPNIYKYINETWQAFTLVVVVVLYVWVSDRVVMSIYPAVPATSITIIYP